MSTHTPIGSRTTRLMTVGSPTSTSRSDSTADQPRVVPEHRRSRRRCRCCSPPTSFRCRGSPDAAKLVLVALPAGRRSDPAAPRARRPECAGHAPVVERRPGRGDGGRARRRRSASSTTATTLPSAGLTMSRVPPSEACTPLVHRCRGRLTSVLIGCSSPDPVRIVCRARVTIHSWNSAMWCSEGTSTPPLRYAREDIAGWVRSQASKSCWFTRWNSSTERVDVTALCHDVGQVQPVALDDRCGRPPSGTSGAR